MTPVQDIVCNLGGTRVRLATYFPDQMSFSQLGRDPRLHERIKSCLAAFGASEAFAPTPGFNAECISPRELPMQIKFSGITLHRNPTKPADCVLLEVGDVWAITPGGCGIIVLAYDGKVAVVHAGQDSLLDRKKIEGGEGREHFSVVYAALDALGACGDHAMANVHAALFNFIPPEAQFNPFSGPHETFNRACAGLVVNSYRSGATVTESGVHLDLASIAVAQLYQRGVLPAHIQRTYERLDERLPHCRMPGREKERYLALVQRLTRTGF